MTEANEKRRTRRRPEAIKQWKPEELRRLSSAYKSGRARKDIADSLGRTEGSVANKIRLLIQGGDLQPRGR